MAGALPLNADPQGLLLFAHGARDASWALPFEAVARLCRERLGEGRVQLAFLEFMTPNLLSAGAALAAQGCSTVDIVPLFLGAGGHVRKDIPALLAQLQAAHPQVAWRLQPAVGEAPAVIAAMAAVALEPRWNLHQFRFVQEAMRRNLNLTETAKALYTSQPGISKAILELEEELGVDIFARHGKRLKRVTEPGQLVLQSIEVIMREVANLKRIGEEYSKQDAGTLSIATTHSQARYVLPGPVAQLRRQFPQVQVQMHQVTPLDVARMLIDDVAEIGLATEALADHPQLVTLPCHDWQHVIVVPAGHRLAQVERPTLEQLAAEPLVTYHATFSGRTRLDQAFARARLSPSIVLEAIDADVIKTYVRLGMGVGIVAELAVRDDPPGSDLVSRPVGHLFGTNTTRVAFKRGAYLRHFVHAFAGLLSERLTRPLIERAMAERPGQVSDNSYEL